MRIQNFLTRLIWHCSLIIMLTLSNCKKEGRPFEVKRERPAVNARSSRFFSDHLPVGPLASAIREFVVKEDQLYHFSEEYARKIGIPRWDKVISVYSEKKTGISHENGPYDSTVSYIPFVKDSQFQVNACLVIKTINNDTSFRMLYQKEYDDFGPDKARSIFHLFASMENHVFGTKKFSITDERLLTNAEKAEMANAGPGRDDITITYTLDGRPGTQNTNKALATEQCNIITYCIQYGLKPFKAGQLNPKISVNSMDTPCMAWGSYTECWAQWIDIPDGWGYAPVSGGTGAGSSGGGSGGGDNASGSNWPSPADPVPCQSGKLANSCEGNGWEPLNRGQVPALEGMLVSGDSFDHNVLIDLSFQTFNSLYEFQVYKDAVGNRNNTRYDLSIPSTILSQQEKVKRGRYNLNFVGGVDVDVILEKIDGFWQIKEVASDTWGFTPMTSWHQTATRKSLAGNEITLEVLGKLHYNVVIEGIGTIYKQDFKFRLKFNNATGELASISRF